MLPGKVRLEWVKPPQQARSQQTLTRLLDAAEAIIDEKGIDAATVSEIAKRAGSSVGAFYSRFADKEALLRCVLQRFNDQAIATTVAVLEPSKWEGIDVVEALETMMVFMLGILRERRHLISALSVRSANDPELSALGERLHESITRCMHALLDHRGHVVMHEDRDTAVPMAVWLVLSAMQARALHGGGSPSDLPDAIVAREVTKMIILYVGLSDGEQDHARRNHGNRRLWEDRNPL